jgi:hypothetical protein
MNTNNDYSLRPKINAILGPSTQTNEGYKMTKVPFVFYEKDQAIDLSFLWEASKSLVFCGWLVKVAFFVDKFRILELHLFWDGGSIILGWGSS